jgi:hypothetical protein
MSEEDSHLEPDSTPWVPLGEPLSWSDAGFFKQELEARGIPTKILASPEQEEEAHARVHLGVTEGDLTMARDTLKKIQAESHHAGPGKKTHKLQAGIGAVFGFVMGLRVGEHVTKNALGIFFFALALGVIAYLGIQGLWSGRDV